MYFYLFWAANLSLAGLVILLICDIYSYSYYHQKVVTTLKKKAYDALYPKIEKFIQKEWEEFQESDIKKDLLAFPLYDGIKESVLQQVKNPVVRKKRNLDSQYCRKAVSSIFEGIAVLEDHEDWLLLDHKIQHIDREIEFALYQAQYDIKNNLSQEITPEINNAIKDFDNKVEFLAKTIFKDKDWITTSGFVSTQNSSRALSLREAANTIASCGNHFENKLLPEDEGNRGHQDILKPLATIAGNADKKDWALFCELIYKASKKDVNYFYSIYQYNTKIENVPIEFLEYAFSWVQSYATSSQKEQMEEALNKLKIDLGILNPNASKENVVDKMLQDFRTRYLSSRQDALNYLECALDADNNTIKQAIMKKQSHLKSLLPNVEEKEDVKTSIRVEMAFLEQYLKSYLNVG